MLPQKQLIETDVDAGVWGDCYRTALATVLGMWALEVPHFYEDVPSDMGDKWDWGLATLQWIDSWLMDKGFVRFALLFGEGLELDQALALAGKVSAGQPYLFSGRSASGLAHVVVCQGNRIVWDPSIHNLGLSQPMAKSNMWLLEIIARPVELPK
jgi:hypothetical protein